MYIIKYILLNTYIIVLDLCEVPNEAEVSNEIIVDNDDVSVNYDSDQSCGSNQTSEAEKHWDTDMEEILQDLEMSDELLVIGTSLNIILLFLSLWASFYGVSATALNHLIRFLHHIFTTMFTNSLVALFPNSLYMVHKYFGLNVDKFTKYVVCIKCGSLYCYNDCIQTSGSREYSKTCYHIQYCHHPHEAR